MEAYEYAVMRDLESNYWWFRGKRFLIGMLLEAYFRDDGSKKALDVGAGTGSILELLAEYGPAYGIELSETALDIMRQRGVTSVVRSDAEEPIPFKSNIFSVVTCFDVLEHLENDTGLMKEMIRVCEPGGHILVTVPAMPFLWSRHDDALHHKRRYSRKKLLERISYLDCIVTRATYYNMSLFFPIAAVRALKNMTGTGRGKPESDFFLQIPGWLNKILYLWFVTELSYLKIIDFPFGLSILVVIEKQ